MVGVTYPIGWITLMPANPAPISDTLRPVELCPAGIVTLAGTVALLGSLL